MPTSTTINGVFEMGVTVAQAARIIGCTVGRVRQLLAEGKHLQGQKLACTDNPDRDPWILDREQVEQYAQREVAPGTPGRGPGRPRRGRRRAAS